MVRNCLWLLMAVVMLVSFILFLAGMAYLAYAIVVLPLEIAIRVLVVVLMIKYVMKVSASYVSHNDPDWASPT